MTVSQFFDPEIRQWAERIQASDPDLEQRVNTFKVYALESAERFQWTDEPELSLNIRARFEQEQSTLHEARAYLVWTVEEFCEGLLEDVQELAEAQAMREYVTVLEEARTARQVPSCEQEPVSRPAHVIVLDWPMVRGGDSA
jgi:hypothetical protein